MFLTKLPSYCTANHLNFFLVIVAKSRVSLTKYCFVNISLRGRELLRLKTLSPKRTSQVIGEKFEFSLSLALEKIPRCLIIWPDFHGRAELSNLYMISVFYETLTYLRTYNFDDDFVHILR